MACRIVRNNNTNEILEVFAKNGEPSILYREILKDIGGRTAGLVEYTKRVTPEVKKGVPELFESNPELANAVYSAMGLTTINESEITYTDEEGNPCAKMGGRGSNFTKGSKWEIVKDLKGYPSHAQGGVDIKLGKDGFSFIRDGVQIMAAHGLVLPKIK